MALSAHAARMVQMHQHVQRDCLVVGDEPGGRVDKSGLRVDAVQLSRLDQLGDHCPIVVAIVRFRKKVLLRSSAVGQMEHSGALLSNSIQSSRRKRASCSHLASA